MNLPFTLGYEMTAIPPFRYKHLLKTENAFWDVKRQFLLSHLANLMLMELRKRYPKMPLKQYTDCHTAEFQSPIFKNKETAIKFYTHVKRLFDKYNLKPQRRGLICGGNHFHAVVTDQTETEKEKLFKYFYRDALPRYYISWVFLHPEDTESGNNELLTSSGWVHIQQRMEDLWGDERDAVISGMNHIGQFLMREESMLHRPNYDADYIYGLSSKENWFTGNGVGVDRINGIFTHSLELRCFAAPKDKGEFIDQLDFAVAYYSHIVSNYLRRLAPIPRFISETQLENIPKEKAIEDFNDCLRFLNLNPARYEKYVKRNLLPRWTNPHAKRC